MSTPLIFFLRGRRKAELANTIWPTQLFMSNFYEAKSGWGELIFATNSNIITKKERVKLERERDKTEEKSGQCLYRSEEERRNQEKREGSVQKPISAYTEVKKKDEEGLRLEDVELEGISPRRGKSNWKKGEVI
jgi:hypothetical protein